jgi:DNA-binding transcriptional regulator YiaG
MSLSDRIAQVQQQRETGHLGGAQAGGFERKQTSPFTRATGSLSLPGETELTLLCRELAVDTRSMAAAIGMSETMLERWQRGLLQPSGSAADRLARVKDLHRRLYSMFQPYQVLSWMRTENGQLGFAAPVDVLAQGQLHRVEAALDYLEG